jgi:hypothetical protein
MEGNLGRSKELKATSRRALIAHPLGARAAVLHNREQNARFHCEDTFLDLLQQNHKDAARVDQPARLWSRTRGKPNRG